jgi:hypothetical protein
MGHARIGDIGINRCRYILCGLLYFIMRPIRIGRPICSGVIFRSLEMI